MQTVITYFTVELKIKMFFPQKMTPSFSTSSLIHHEEIKEKTCNVNSQKLIRDINVSFIAFFYL